MQFQSFVYFFLNLLVLIKFYLSIFRTISLYDVDNGQKLTDVSVSEPYTDEFAGLQYIKPIKNAAQLRNAKENYKDEIFTLWLSRYNMVTTVFYAAGGLRFQWSDNTHYRVSGFSSGNNRVYLGTKHKLECRSPHGHATVLLCNPLVRLAPYRWPQPASPAQRQNAEMKSIDNDDNDDDNDTNMSGAKDSKIKPEPVDKFAPFHTETPAPCEPDAPFQSDPPFHSERTIIISTAISRRTGWNNDNNDNHNHNHNHNDGHNTNFNFGHD